MIICPFIDNTWNCICVCNVAYDTASSNVWTWWWRRMAIRLSLSHIYIWAGYAPRGSGSLQNFTGGSGVACAENLSSERQQRRQCRWMMMRGRSERERDWESISVFLIVYGRGEMLAIIYVYIYIYMHMPEADPAVGVRVVRLPGRGRSLRGPIVKLTGSGRP